MVDVLQGARRKLALLLASSRTAQAHLSIAQPALGALLAAGAIPSARTIGFGLIAAWTGLHAVFAMNDLLDVEVDRERFTHLKGFAGFDVDSVIARHPLAQGALRRRELVAWIAVNATVAVVFAWLLHPSTVALFVISAAFEVLYCRLAKRTAMKFLVTGVMVAIGASAGWFAVSRRIDWTLVVFLLWMAAWEIGGRNIVNDWSDVEEDRHLGIRTIPVVYGPRVASRLVLGFLVLTAVLGLILLVPSGLGPVAGVGALVAGGLLLVWPGILLATDQASEDAHRLFNRASLYPPAMMVAVGLDLLVQGRL